MLVIEDLVWNEQNIAHIARHDVTQQEVEDVVFGNPIPSETYGGRLRLIGLTSNRRMITVIVSPKSVGLWFVVTARSSSKKERQFFRQQRGGETVLH
jgi:hypothetical protein